MQDCHNNVGGGCLTRFILHSACTRTSHAALVDHVLFYVSYAAKLTLVKTFSNGVWSQTTETIDKLSVKIYDWNELPSFTNEKKAPQMLASDPTRISNLSQFQKWKESSSLDMILFNIVARDLPGGKRSVINMMAHHITFNKAIKPTKLRYKEFLLSYRFVFNLRHLKTKW